MSCRTDVKVEGHKSGKVVDFKPIVDLQVSQQETQCTRVTEKGQTYGNGLGSGLESNVKKTSFDDFNNKQHNLRK